MEDDVEKSMQLHEINQLEVHHVNDNYSGSNFERGVYTQAPGCFRSKQSQEKHGPRITDPCCTVLDCWRNVLGEPCSSNRKDLRTVRTWAKQSELQPRIKENSGSDIESLEYFQASSCEKHTEVSEKSSIVDLSSLITEEANESEDLSFVYDGVIATVRRLKKAFTQIIDNENLHKSESGSISSSFKKIDNYRKMKNFDGPTTSSSMNDNIIKTGQDMMPTLSIKMENEKPRLVKSRTHKRITHKYLRNQNSGKAYTRSSNNDEIIETGQDIMMPTLSIITENEKQGLDKSRSRRRTTIKDNHNYQRNRSREDATCSSNNDEIMQTKLEMNPFLSMMNKIQKHGSKESRSRRKITAEDIRNYFDEKEEKDYLASQKKTDDSWFTALRKRLSEFLSYFTSNDN